MTGRMSYRQDLDGLRGFAVILVMLHHCDLPSFAGGYFGVDIFFTLSGYLITTLILLEIMRNSDESSSKRPPYLMDLWGFFIRRMKRLQPALLLMLIVIIPFSWVYSMRDQIRPMYIMALTGMFWHANVWYYEEMDVSSRRNGDNAYWDQDKTPVVNPVTHLWSLSVEEQFYLAWPFCCVFVAWLVQKRLCTFKDERHVNITCCPHEAAAAASSSSTLALKAKLELLLYLLRMKFATCLGVGLLASLLFAVSLVRNTKGG